MLKMSKDGLINQFKKLPKFIRKVKSEGNFWTLPQFSKTNEGLCLSEFHARETLTDKLGPPERRFEVANVNFRIVGSEKTKIQSLFTAISEALTGSGDDWKAFLNKTYSFIKEEGNWQDYHPRILDTFTSFDGSENRNYIIKKLKEKSPGTLIELHAAARRLRFTFSVIFIEGMQDAERESPMCEIYTSHDPDVSGWAEGVKYYFLRWGASRDSDRHWELLVPIGPLMDISDGKYAYELKEAFEFPEKSGSKQASKEYRSPLSLNTKLVFSYKLREFKYKKTNATNIYSILSEILFQTDAYTNDIRFELEERRHKLAYFLHLSPRRKTTLENGSFGTDTYAFAKTPFLNGDPTDVKLAGTMFSFSYIIFGLVNGDMGKWDQFLVEQVDGDENAESPWLAFLCQTEHSKVHQRNEHEWFLLEETRHLGNHITSEVAADHVNECLLDPIRPVPSQYQSTPLRPTMDFLRPERRWLTKNGIFSKSKNPTITLLLPKKFPSYPEEKTKPILRVKSELARRIQFELFHKPGLQESFVVHPDLDYYPVNVRKDKPSTCFPLLARSYCKPPEAMTPSKLEHFQFEPALRRKSSYSALRELRKRVSDVAGAVGRVASRAGSTVSGLAVAGLTRVVNVVRKGARNSRLLLERASKATISGYQRIVKLKRNIGAHFKDTIR